MAESRILNIGPQHPDAWWDEHNPSGSCVECGSDCDGPECGLHAAGCVFGGPSSDSYWLYADDCPLWHGFTDGKTIDFAVIDEPLSNDA